MIDLYTFSCYFYMINKPWANDQLAKDECGIMLEDGCHLKRRILRKSSVTAFCKSLGQSSILIPVRSKLVECNNNIRNLIDSK